MLWEERIRTKGGFCGNGGWGVDSMVPHLLHISREKATVGAHLVQIFPFA